MDTVNKDGVFLQLGYIVDDREKNTERVILITDFRQNRHIGYNNIYSALYDKN